MLKPTVSIALLMLALAQTAWSQIEQRKDTDRVINLGNQGLGQRSTLPSARTGKWKRECGNQSWGESIRRYCTCVGETVYDRHTKLRVGEISGVAWRPKGTLIGNTDERVSGRDAFYYIVDDGTGQPFLKDPRQSRFPNGSTQWCKDN